MYKVYCDGELIYQPGNDSLVLINPKVDIEVNKSGSFDFTISSQNPMYDSIKKLKSKISVFQGDKEIFFGRPTDTLEDFYNRKKVHCEGALSYLNDSVQRPKEYIRVTIREYLVHLIDSHNAQVEEDKRFEVGVVTVTDPNNYISRYTNWETTLKAISEDLVNSLGGYIFVRNENGKRYIDYYAELPNTNTQTIEFGSNLLDFSKNYTVADIATCIIPLGARKENPEIEALGERLTISEVNNGSDTISSTEAINVYGKINKTVTYDDVHIPSILKKKGENYLKSVQWERMILEVKAIDLNAIDKSFEQFNIGEYVRVISKPHGMNRNFPLTKMSIKLDKLSENTIVLGTSRTISMSDSNIAANEEIKKNLERLPQKYEIVKLAKDNATQLINNAMNGFVVKNNDELLIMDTNSIVTAKKVWRWNVNGLGYSSNGYNGPYETAITMDGTIVANAITTGTINGGSVKWDLDDSTFIFGKDKNDYSLMWDGKTLKFGSGSISKDDLSAELKRELKGEPGRDGDPGERGPQGPPGESGSAILPDSLKQWDGNATEINGKYIYSPELFVGNSGDLTSSDKNGIFIGSDIEVKFGGRLQKLTGMVGIKKGEAVWYFSDSGDFVIGTKFGERLQLGADGRAILPTIDSRGIKARSIKAENIETGTITASEIAANTITASEIKSGAITTDMLYPGAKQRIVFDRNANPGSNTAMSIDANEKAIRLKYNANVYFKASSGGSCEAYDYKTVFRASSNGCITWTGWKDWSDSKLKENLSPIDSTTVLRKNPKVVNEKLTSDEIKKFLKESKFYNYNYIGQNLPKFSIVTQGVSDQVKKILVTKAEGSGEFESVDMYMYISMLHFGIKDLYEENKKLEKRIEQLETKINKEVMS